MLWWKLGWGNPPCRHEITRLRRFYGRRTDVDVLSGKEPALDVVPIQMNKLVRPGSEGLTVNDHHPVAHAYIFIDMRNIYLLDIDVGDVYAVPAVVTAAVIYFSGRQRNPCYIVVCPDPADKPRSPVYLARKRRHPAPAYAGSECPSAVMVGRPSPWVTGYPDIVTADPCPSAQPVRRPADTDRRGPAITVIRDIDPPASVV